MAAVSTRGLRCRLIMATKACATRGRDIKQRDYSDVSEANLSTTTSLAL